MYFDIPFFVFEITGLKQKFPNLQRHKLAVSGEDLYSHGCVCVYAALGISKTAVFVSRFE